jgi:hypothetical protein
VYSDFYEIPLPALHFEKTEEIDTKSEKNDTEERNNDFQTDAQRKEKNDVKITKTSEKARIPVQMPNSEEE